MRRAALSRLFPVAILVMAVPVRADIQTLAKCQKSIAREGAKYAMRVIKSTLECTEAIANCQVQCELGVFGPPCDTNPPPCCDPDDPGSNPAFGACMSEADTECDVEAAKRAKYEVSKQDHITTACLALTQEELCGSQAVGLNFATLNAGCQALDPGYTCNLTNLVNCVGGPLEKALLDQISATLSPRASDAVAAANLQSQFPDIPLARKVKGQVAEGKVDVWAFSGQAGDAIIARVNTRDDTGGDASMLHPVLALLDGAKQPVPDTTVRTMGCAVTNVCGSSCPLFKRTLPFNGTFHLAVLAFPGDSCAGGKYKLTLISPGGATPALVDDDVDPTTTP
jgi:hypothetical protein